MKLKKDYIYLDHNATTVVKPEVCSKLMAAYEAPYNASAIHSTGREAKLYLGQVRTLLRETVDAEQSEIFFTSGGTESNNIVLQSAMWEQIFCSATEHDSVYKGPITQTIPVLSSGLLNLELLKKLLEKNPGKKTLVSVHWANNETGVIQPIEEISEIVHHYGAWFHVDGVQVFGKIPVSFNRASIDFLSLSAHKMGGPQGVGALVAKKNAPLSPLFFGGGQEQTFRSGTENVAGIIGFGESIRHIDLEIFSTLKTHHTQLEEELLQFAQSYGRDVWIVGKDVDRLPNTTCIALSGVSNKSQLIYFDLERIGVSIGSACSSSTVKPSRVLRNMGLSEKIVESAIRISSGWDTRDSDFLKFKEAWKALFLRHN